MSLERAKYDWLRFSNSGGFEVLTTITPTVGSQVSAKGLATKHFNSVNSDGIPTNSKNVHVSYVESYLVSLGLTVRNANKEINMRNWRVSFPDSSNVIKNYIIVEMMPDETLGVIVCILEDYVS